ncbi:MAG: phage Gp37/Gp68 family protein [Rubrivivax sp.]|nr:phage Gp37/Gp68 family protein [Rubrivivax sp.]
MAEKTGISWTDATFNPWWGCQKVSPACDHCYAERDAKRFAAGKVLWGVGSERRVFPDKPDGKNPHWAAPLTWAKTMPAKLGRRPRVFCASMGDWLDLDAPIDDFVRLLDTIRRTPELDWLLLSKRIGNWRKRAESAWQRAGNAGLDTWLGAWLDGEPPANVWLGATVIDQAEADRDIPKLLATPAAVRFLSIEPMLGPIQLTAEGRIPADDEGPARIGYMVGPDDGASSLWPTPAKALAASGLHWVIVGGESGRGARPMPPDWPRSLRDQCAAAGVPFHFKQWGEWAPIEDIDDNADGTINCIRDDGTSEPIEGRVTIMRAHGHDFAKVGKTAAGCLLDGVEAKAWPSAA